MALAGAGRKLPPNAIGGPWLLAECAKHRTRENTSPLLDGVRLAHAACWLSSTLLPLITVLVWMVDV